MSFTRAEAVAELQWRKCRDDPAYFFENFWHISHPERGAMKFELFDAQRRALSVFQNERNVLTLKARQIGWTTLVAGYSFWFTFFFPDRAVIFISKNQDEAKFILKKVKYGFQRLPDWLKQRGPKATANNVQVLPFSNDSGIESMPSLLDPARGRTASLIIVDEWASLENQDDAWSSIEPTTDVGGRCIGLSTAKGIGNWFHGEWEKAQIGASIFTPIFEPWNARDDRTADWYAAKKEKLPTWLLFQEYPSNPDEAFIKSGNPYFDVDKLRTLPTEEGRRGHIVTREVREFDEFYGGSLEVWELPIRDEKYVIGADVAMGLEHGDFSAAFVKRLRTNEIVAHYHAHVDPDSFGEILAELGWFYNAALVGVENNSFGLTTCKAVQRTGYSNIYYSKIVERRNEAPTPRIGWSTTTKTKPVMIADLHAALRDDAIVVKDKETIAELCGYVQDENAKLHGSPYDDRTMALAITEQMSHYAHQYDHKQETLQWGQLKWWDQTLKPAEKERVPIGAHNVRSSRWDSGSYR